MSWGERRAGLRAVLAYAQAQLRAGHRWILIVEAPHVECGYQLFSPTDAAGDPVWTDHEVVECLVSVLDAGPPDGEQEPDPSG